MKAKIYSGEADDGTIIYNEFHFRIEEIESFEKIINDDNELPEISLGFISGRNRAIEYEEEIWNKLVNHFEGTSNAESGTTPNNYSVSFDGLVVNMTREEFEEYEKSTKPGIDKDINAEWQGKIEQWHEKTGYKYFR